MMDRSLRDPRKSKGLCCPISFSWPRLGPFTFERHDARAQDVIIDIIYCGICYSDILHTARNAWEGIRYRTVPGHEIVGQVVAVGKMSKITRPAIW